MYVYAYAFPNSKNEHTLWERKETVRQIQDSFRLSPSHSLEIHYIKIILFIWDLVSLEILTWNREEIEEENRQHRKHYADLN